MLEIIIDGVDVCKCENFYAKPAYDNLCYKECDGCEKHPNCVYKQLKRLKQENTRLKEENQNNAMKKCPLCGGEFFTPVGAELYDENLKYKQALQEIKEIKEIVTDAESKLNCVCDITEMLINIEGKISEVLDD